MSKMIQLNPTRTENEINEYIIILFQQKRDFEN